MVFVHLRRRYYRSFHRKLNFQLKLQFEREMAYYFLPKQQLDIV
jgi:hypothetical protein